MTVYCVWFDNFLEELFAIEKSEFDLYPNLKSRLDLEKNSITFLNADSITDAFSKYKQVNNRDHLPALSIIH